MGRFEPFGYDYGEALHEGVFLRFPGQWDDESWSESSVESPFYNVYRWYGLQVGSFLTADPLGQNSGDVPSGALQVERSPQATNVFSYSSSVPTVLTDSFGLYEYDPCDGYDFARSSCCRNGSRKPDPYVAEAQQVCRRFLEQHESSMVVVCVARCLVRKEQGTTRRKCCSARNAKRLNDHARCYASCGFLPNPFTLPEGGWTLGLTNLFPDWVRGILPDFALSPEPGC